MKGLIDKLKPIFLLSLMLIVSVFVVMVVNTVRSKVSSKDNTVSESKISGSILAMKEITPNEDIQKVSEVKDESEVLAASASNTKYSCNREDFIEIKTESICKRDAKLKEGFYEKENGARLIGGSKVSVNAQIVLSKVTIPLELFSGVEVRDSNRIIEKETPTLKPAGEQIDEKVANVMLPPNTQITEYKEIVEDKPFKNKYSTAFADKEDSKSESGNIGVEDELGNGCENEEVFNNKSNVNPQKSNSISEFMQDSLYRTPGEKVNKVVKTIDECAENATFEDWISTQEYVACKADLITRAIERFKNIVGWGDLFNEIIKCKFAANDDPDCIKVEDIVIIMSSPFGSDEDCATGSACTNTFMKTRNSVVSVPDADLGPKQYYLTPCKAFIQGLSYEADIKCAWDMSHLFKERKLNEYDDIPTVDSTPTDEEYNNFLQEQVKGTRGAAREIQ